ncbi:MAG: DUF1439 domain-containing protein [Dechloromonas sp.]|uniref:DUF1439 domain-containing protein n=1 Tax=Candidatus Dechloromonas phosphorivorans TaxID=2899244 RepID=A0A9D7LNL5_9RHOO|nr:DUF1439 domain-containing protein [Candidatus Dechloromonas phosphorivorans]
MPGNPPIPLQVQGHAGIRYDDQAKAFFLENPVAEAVESVALPREFEPQVRRAVSQLIAAYFRDRPVLRAAGKRQRPGKHRTLAAALSQDRDRESRGHPVTLLTRHGSVGPSANSGSMKPALWQTSSRGNLDETRFPRLHRCRRSEPHIPDWH